MGLMEWTAVLGNLGEFVAAIAVVVTLFYLAVQVRHGRSATEANTRSLDESHRLAVAQAYQQRVDHAQANIRSWRESEHLALLFGLVEPASDEDRIRLHLHLRGYMNFCDNLHLQHELGFIDDELYQRQIEEMIPQFAPRWRQAGVKELRSSFRAEVDRILRVESSTEGAA